MPGKVDLDQELGTTVTPPTRTPRRRLSHDAEVLIEARAAGAGTWDDIVRARDWDVGRTPPMALH